MAGGKESWAMRQILTIFGILLVLVASSAVAGEIDNPAATEQVAGRQTSSLAKSVDLTLVAAPRAVQQDFSGPENELPPELEPALLRERAYTETTAFAGVEVELPTSPLSIVLAADDLLNPTCGLKLDLVW